jgi:hypothetical protein
MHATQSGSQRDGIRCFQRPGWQQLAPTQNLDRRPDGPRLGRSKKAPALRGSIRDFITAAPVLPETA